MNMSTFRIFPSHCVEKGKGVGAFALFNIQFVAKYQNLNGDPSVTFKTFGKSHSDEKIEKGNRCTDLYVFPRRSFS